MREDGLYAIYQIQHYVERTKKWDFSNLDHFGYPKGFGASGECWQETGVHGCFDLKTAKQGLQWIRKVNKVYRGASDKKYYKFRLVLVIASQITLVV